MQATQLPWQQFWGVVFTLLVLQDTSTQGPCLDSHRTCTHNNGMSHTLPMGFRYTLIFSLSVYGCTCMRECFSPIFNQEYGLSIWQQYLLISCSDFAVFPLLLSNSSCSHSGCFCVLVNLLLTDLSLSYIFWLCDPIKIHQPIVCKV